MVATGDVFNKLIKKTLLPAALAAIAHLVEHQFPKLKAAGSSPVRRSLLARLPVSLILY